MTDTHPVVKNLSPAEVARENAKPAHERIDGFEIGFIDEREADVPRDGGHFIVGDAIRASINTNKPLGILEADGTLVVVLISPQQWKRLYELEQRTIDALARDAYL